MGHTFSHPNRAARRFVTSNNRVWSTYGDTKGPIPTDRVKLASPQGCPPGTLRLIALQGIGAEFLPRISFVWAPARAPPPPPPSPSPSPRPSPSPSPSPRLSPSPSPPPGGERVRLNDRVTTPPLGDSDSSKPNSFDHVGLSNNGAGSWVDAGQVRLLVPCKGCWPRDARVWQQGMGDWHGLTVHGLCLRTQACMPCTEGHLTCHWSPDLPVTLTSSPLAQATYGTTASPVAGGTGGEERAFNLAAGEFITQAYANWCDSGINEIWCVGGLGKG